jgi:NAD(P)-dependent dehydrogenase (short-subunit alcohol dehydrogenase family)
LTARDLPRDIQGITQDFSGESTMTGRLQGSVAIVTGAAQGIGAAYAKAMAAEGAKIVIADVIDGNGGIVDEIRAAGGEAVSIKTDVSSEGAVKALVAETLRLYGKIDILVNNAAMFANLPIKHFTEIDGAEWDKVMAVNVRGPFECAKAVVPAMRANGYGKIINIASGTVFKGTPGYLHYVTSKGAIVAMTRVMARELGADNICVNALAPGLTTSEGVINNPSYTDESLAANASSRAFKRLQQPDDLVGAIVFLASHDSDFMTGQTMLVDGGSAMH